MSLNGIFFEIFNIKYGDMRHFTRIVGDDFWREKALL